MALWRCPHCGTPQAETARCWVCRRSSTTCSTCRHFRRSIAGQLGFCGLDRRRQPLVGTELRGCWEDGGRRAADGLPVAADPPAALPDLTSPAVRLREFVPVELAGPDRSATTAAVTAESTDGPSAETAAVAIAPTAASWSDRATLFLDADR